MKKHIIILLAACTTFLSVFLQAHEIENEHHEIQWVKEGVAPRAPEAGLPPSCPRYDESHQIMMGPASTVDGCVNVITGTFFDFETDLEITGTPLNLTRNYSSGMGSCPPTDSASYVEECLDLFRGWGWNHSTLLYRRPYWFVLSLGNIHTGSKDVFEINRSSFEGKIHPTLFKNWNNCSGGYLGGQSDMHNQCIRMNDPKGNSWVAILEDGTKRYFNGHPESYAKAEAQFWNCHETERVFPNKTRLQYQHESLYQFKRVSFTNESGNQVIGYIERNEPACFKDSLGNYAKYSLREFPAANGAHPPHLKPYDKVPVKVEYSNKPPIVYEYIQYIWGYVANTYVPGIGTMHLIYNVFTAPLLTKKTYPAGRYLQIQYLDGFPKAWSHKGRLKTSDLHPHAGKVTALLAPLGKSSEAKIKYTFDYQANRTVVKDACGSIQEFCFDQEKRLTQVISKNGNDNELIRHYRWGKERSGYLDRQWATSGKGEVLYCKCFNYDQKGNVTKEELHGNISGLAPPLKIVDGEIKDSQEFVTTTYRYSQDAFNLLLEEKFSSGKEVEYIYAPESNLLIARLEKMGEEVVARSFYSYDQYSNPILVIEDDASGKDPSKFDDAVVRKIKRRQACNEGYAIGLIQNETQSYFDFEKQTEIELTRVEYSYNPQRLVEKKTVWVANQDTPIVSEFSYNSFGQVVRELLPNGAIIERTYDANGNIKSETSSDGKVKSEYEYDFMNRLTQKTEIHPLDRFTTKYTYDLMGKLLEEISPFGNIKRYTYDTLGRVIEQKFLRFFDTEGNSTKVWDKETFAFDAFGRLIEKKDALGYSEKSSYNCMGELVYEHKPGQPSLRYEYNLQGLRVSSFLGTGSKEFYTYDGLGRKLSLERLDENSNVIFSQTFQYKRMKLESATDSLGRTDSFTYDGAGRVILKKVLDEDGNVLQKETYAYDGLDRIVVHRQYSNDQDYIERLYTYTTSGKALETIARTRSGVILEREAYEYDLCLRVIKETKFAGGKEKVQIFEYDTFGKPIRVVNALGDEWTYENEYAVEGYREGILLNCTKEYRPDGTQKVEWTTAEGLTLETTTYDQEGCLVYKANYGYDLYGGCTFRNESIIDPEGISKESIISRVKFGPARRILERVDSDADSIFRTRKWTFNEMGMLISHQKPSGTILNYEYDSIGLLKHVQSSDGSVDQFLCHDPLGRLLEVRDVNGVCIKREYNALGQVVYEDLGQAREIGKKYDGLGRVLETELPGIKLYRQYDDGLLRSVRMEGLLGCYEHKYLEYDDEGRIVSEQLADGTKLTRGYDLIGRNKLVESAHFKNDIRSFDPFGKVLEMERGFDSLSRITFTYDALGQLSEENKNGNTHNYLHNSVQQRVKKDLDNYSNNEFGELLGISGDSSRSFEYDLDGRLIAYDSENGSFNLKYDAFDRLTEIRSSSGEVYQYLYDGLDRRIAKRITTSKNEVTEEAYVFDEFFEVGAMQDGSWKNFRLIGIRSQAETGDTLLAVIDGKAYACLLDLQGSIVGWIDIENQNLVRCCEYDAFGVTSGEGMGPWGYVSKRVDPETQWIFFGKRYYLPNYGRWLTRDPKGEIDGSNLYAFLRNNPVYNWDLWGLSSFSTAIGIKDKPYVKDISSGKFYQHEIEQIEKDLLEIHNKIRTQYPEKEYNTQTICILKDPKAPWVTMVNGILNDFNGCHDTAIRLSDDTYTNVLWTYYPTRGAISDCRLLTNQNLLGNYENTPVPELYMRNTEYALEQNTKNGFERVIACSHSQGGTQMLLATKTTTPDFDFNKALFFASSSPAHSNIGHKHAQSTIVNSENDWIAKIGRFRISTEGVRQIEGSWNPVTSHFLTDKTNWNELTNTINQWYSDEFNRYKK